MMSLNFHKKFCRKAWSEEENKDTFLLRQGTMFDSSLLKCGRGEEKLQAGLPAPWGLDSTLHTFPSLSMLPSFIFFWFNIALAIYFLPDFMFIVIHLHIYFSRFFSSLPIVHGTRYQRTWWRTKKIACIFLLGLNQWFMNFSTSTIPGGLVKTHDWGHSQNFFFNNLFIYLRSRDRGKEQNSPSFGSLPRYWQWIQLGQDNRDWEPYLCLWCG